VPFKKGVSGNPSGWPKGKPHKLTSAVREIVERDGPAIVEEIAKAAKDGDVEARLLFLRFLLPRPRMVLTPIDLPPARDAAEAQTQISMLTSMAAKGDLDLDALHALSRALALAIEARLGELEELEEILGERESRGDDDA
jgi:hypothetical protein